MIVDGIQVIIILSNIIGINDINYENKNTEWTNKLPREKIEYRYDKVISEDEQIHSLKNNHDLSEINRYGIMDII